MLSEALSSIVWASSVVSSVVSPVVSSAASSVVSAGVSSSVEVSSSLSSPPPKRFSKKFTILSQKPPPSSSVEGSVLSELSEPPSVLSVTTSLPRMSSLVSLMIPPTVSPPKNPVMESQRLEKNPPLSPFKLSSVSFNALTS